MANTNLYNVLSGLLSASQNFNDKIGSKNSQNGTIYEQLTAISGVAGNAMSQMNLADGATSGLVYAPTTGGDVNIAAGLITVKTGAITSGKLATSVNNDIANGKAAYGIVSSSTAGEWHKHTNKTFLDGITDDKIADWDEAAVSAHFHNNKTVLDGITADKITAWDNGAKISGVILEKLTTPTAGYAATYQLKVNGTALSQKIDIVKDRFIKSGEIVSGTWNGNNFTPGTGSGKALKLVLWVEKDGAEGETSDETEQTIYINVADLVDVYTGTNGVKVDGYQISLSGIPTNISIPSGNLAQSGTYQTAVNRAAAYAAASGTLVKTAAATTFTSGTVVLGNGSQQVKNSSYTVVTASGDFGADTLATAPAITGYIAAQNFQAANPDYVTASANLTLDQIVLGSGNKTVKESGLKVGTTSGAISTAASGTITIPRSDAVSSYVANKTANMVTASANLTNNNLVIGNGSKGVTASSIAAANVVTAIANFAANDIVIGVNNTTRAVQKSGYSITTVKADVSAGTASKVPTVGAVKGYVDDQDAAAKNYLLNGNASTSTGVAEWGADSGEGSLAQLQSDIDTLLEAL